MLAASARVRLSQLLDQLHVFGQKIANNFAEIPALLLRDTLQTLLQLTVKVDWQTQAAALPVKLAPLRFGKVGMRFIV